MRDKSWLENGKLPNAADDSDATRSPGAADWRAVLKVAATDWRIAAADVACLLERNVVAKSGRALGVNLGFNHDDHVVLGLTV